jgi:hypothetical protein
VIALYKVGSGEDITKAEVPGTFDMKVSAGPPVHMNMVPPSPIHPAAPVQFNSGLVADG